MPLKLTMWGVSVDVEVPAFLLLLSQSLCDTLTTNLVLEKTCRVTLGYNETICRLLPAANNQSDAAKEMANNVQVAASVVLMTRTVIESVIPTCMLLFLGPWSDRRGRRPLLLLSISGFILFFVIMVTQAMWFDLSPWWMLTASAPIVVTGKINAFLIACFSFIGDNTTITKRSTRMAVFDAVAAIGLVLGSTATSFFFNKYGYVPVYLVCLMLVLASFSFTYFFIHDIVRDDAENETDVGLLSLRSAVDLVKTCVRPRPHHDRAVLCLAMLVTALALMPLTAGGDLKYLYVEAKFHWSLERYTLFNSLLTTSTIVCSLLFIYVLHTRLGVRDAILMLIPGCVDTLKYTIVALAQTEWQFYLGSSLCALGNVINPMAKSVLSKVASVDEQARIFSFESMMIALSPLIFSPLYTYIYDMTVSSEPGLYNLLSTLFYVVTIVCVSFIIRLQRRNDDDVQYGPAINE